VGIHRTGIKNDSIGGEELEKCGARARLDRCLRKRPFRLDE
jgi:hypothetical protein